MSVEQTPNPCSDLLSQLDKVRRDDGSRQDWKVSYHFNGKDAWIVDVEEVDDGHHFVGGRGATPEEAATNAIGDIAEVAEYWGWTYTP